MIKKQIANIITGSRALFGIAMLFFRVFSAPFYVLYLLCGFTDMIDGTVARKTGSATVFGSYFDTAADLVFVICALVKILPRLSVPLYITVWIAVIAVIKITNIVSGLVLEKKIIVKHTVMNKITGVLLFLLPLTLSFIELKESAPAVCACATFAAIQEGHFIRKGV